MCIAQGHSTMTVVLRLGIEPRTPGFEIPDANGKPLDHSGFLIYLDVLNLNKTFCFFMTLSSFQSLISESFPTQIMIILVLKTFCHNVFNFKSIFTLSYIVNIF